MPGAFEHVPATGAGFPPESAKAVEKSAQREAFLEKRAAPFCEKAG